MTSAPFDIPDWFYAAAIAGVLLFGIELALRFVESRRTQR